MLIFLLVGCQDEKTLMGIEADVRLQVTIPLEIVQQYGMLQLDKDIPDLDRMLNADGSITLMLNEEEVNYIVRDVEELFNQYEQAVKKEPVGQITDISYDDFYENIQFFVTNKQFIYTENFMLAEEMLIKHALAYQLIHQKKLGIFVQYSDRQGKQIFSKKAVPLHVSAQN